MYRIFMLEYDQVSNTLIDGFPILIYDDENFDTTQKLISPVLTLEDSRAGSLTFIMPVENVGYSKVSALKSTLVVKRRVINPSQNAEKWETIWEGRVISESTDFYNQLSVTCEGALAYLNDEYVLKWEELIQAQTTEMPYNNKKIQFKAIFKYLLAAYNIQHSAILHSSEGAVSTIIVKAHDRCIYVEDSNIADYFGNDALDFSSDYETIIDYINNSILDRHGGHVKIIKQSNNRGDYDYTDENPNTRKALCLEYTQEYYSLDLDYFRTGKSYSKGDHIVYDPNNPDPMDRDYKKFKVYRFKNDHRNGPVSLSELEIVPNVKVVKIELKKNLIDLRKEVDGTDWCTAVLVTGGRNERYYLSGDPSEADDMHKNVFDEETIPDPTLNSDWWAKGNNNGAASMADQQYNSIIIDDYPMDPGFSITKVQGALTFAWEPPHYKDILPCYVVNNTAANAFGIIAKQLNANFAIKKNEDPQPGEYKYDYQGSAMLYRAGIDFLKEHSPDYFSVEVSALDMNFIDSDAPYANIGDIFYVKSSIHDMDGSSYFILTKLTIPLDSPESSMFTLNRKASKSISRIVV